VIDFDLNLNDITVMITFDLGFLVYGFGHCLLYCTIYYTSTSSVGIYFCFSIFYTYISCSFHITLLPLSIPIRQHNHHFYFIIFYCLSYHFVHGATSMLYHVDRGIQSFLTFIRYMHFFTALSMLYNMTTPI
jgi:hypothetical protein